MNSEKGQAMPLAILALALGTLVIAPFLGHASSSLIGSRVYEQGLTELYSSDAGIEHAIWNLTGGPLAGELAAPEDTVSYELGEAINGSTPLVTVTAQAIDNGVAPGDIASHVINTLEFDTADGYEPSIAHVSGEVYAIAYRGDNNDGFLKTVTIAANGSISNSAIDTLEFDTNAGYEPNIVHVSGDVYAIAYRGDNNDGFLKTVSVAANGNIGNAAIDTLEFDTANGYEPSIIHISGEVYAIAYRGDDNDGFLKTVTIAANGSIGNAAIDTLEFDTANGYEPSIIHISGDVYAVAYRGDNSDGFLKTVSIAANGNIGNSAIDTLEFDTVDGHEPSLIRVSGEVYAIAYRGDNNDGFLKTVTIAANGNIGNSAIDTLEFDSTDGYEPSVTHVSGEVYAVAYRGDNGDGFIKTVSIAANGSIGNTAIDTLEFDTTDGHEPSLIHVSGEVYAVAYRGDNSDGFLKTVEIAAGAGASATYMLVSTAGRSTIRASVNIASDNVSVLSWEITVRP